MDKILDGVYYLEYSPIQKCYNIDTIDRIIQGNMEKIARDIHNGYVIIGCGTYEDMQNLSDDFKAKWGRP